MLALGAALIWGLAALLSGGGCVTVPTLGTCPLPQEIEHGRIVQLVRFECDPFYQLRGPGKGLYQCDQWQQASEGEKSKLPICEPVCGRPKSPARPLQRIIGGFMAARNNFPWQMKLVTRHNRTTGATLISDQWLLTTGRNLYLNHSAKARPEEIAPTLRLFLGNGESAGPVDRIVLHPGFPEEVDLALLRLQRKVPIGETVMPICLPQKDYIEPGRVGFIAGWGRNVLMEHPTSLRYVQLPVVDQEICTAYYAGQGKDAVKPLLGNYTFCAGMSRFREDTCYGDAGGAFTVQDPDDDTWYAAGILSFDKTCSTAKYGVYVRVLGLVDWIQETLAAA
nr:haptoglobin-like isoform X1 [Pogona vitticeps]